MLVDHRRDPSQVFAVAATIQIGRDPRDQLGKNGSGSKVPKVPFYQWQVLGQEVDTSASLVASDIYLILVGGDFNVTIQSVGKRDEAMCWATDFVQGPFQC